VRPFLHAPSYAFTLPHALTVSSLRSLSEPCLLVRSSVSLNASILAPTTHPRPAPSAVPSWFFFSFIEPRVPRGFQLVSPPFPPPPPPPFFLSPDAPLSTPPPPSLSASLFFPLPPPPLPLPFFVFFFSFTLCFFGFFSFFPPSSSFSSSVLLRYSSRFYPSLPPSSLLSRLFFLMSCAPSFYRFSSSPFLPGRFVPLWPQPLL